MILQRFSLSLLVSLAGLSFVSSPAKALVEPETSGLHRVKPISATISDPSLKPLAQLTQANPAPAAPANPSPAAAPAGDSRIWVFGLVSLAIGSALGGSLFYLTRRSGVSSEPTNAQVPFQSNPRVLRPSQTKSFPTEPLTVASHPPLSLENQSNGHPSTLRATGTTNGGTSAVGLDGGQSRSERSNSYPKSGSGHSADSHADDLAVGEASPLAKHVSNQPHTETNLAIEETTRLSRVSIVDELIQDLQSPDRGKRSKAIWELGQQGNSQAVQPLVDLMIDSDSKQRSLILAALSEIGVRTLKPMNRALAISLQDDNPEVRKNAIRDLTRIYDMVSQISQLLRHATEDPDTEVQETARWALNQVGRIRTAAGLDGPTLQGTVNPQDQLPGS